MELVRSQNFNRLFPVKPEALEHYLDVYEKPNEKDEEFFDSVTIIKDRNIQEVIDKFIIDIYKK